MGPEPMNRYEPPGYPTKGDFPADHPLMGRTPRRWQRNAAVVVVLTATAALVGGAVPAQVWGKIGCCASHTKDRVLALIHGQPRQLPGAMSAPMPLNEGDIPSVASGIARWR